MDSLSAERLLVRDTPPPPGTADDDDGDVEKKTECSSTPRSFEASDSVRRYETDRNRSPLSRKDDRRDRSRDRYERSRDSYRRSRDRRSSRRDYNGRRRYDGYYRRHRERSRSSSRSARSSGRRRSSHSRSRHSRSHRSHSRSSSYTSRRSYNEGECSRSSSRGVRRSERRRSRSRSRSNSRTYRRRSKSLERSRISSSRSNVSTSDDDTSSQSGEHLSGYSNSKPQSSLKAVMEREVIKNFIHAKVQQFAGKTRPGDVFQNMPPAAEVPFKNDGSFLEMFKKMQEEKQKQECSTEGETTSLLNASTISDLKRTSSVPTIGKRRGGRILKTGVVEKKLMSVEEESPKDAWSIYMKEVRRYKEACCDDDSKTRPLVK